MFDFLDSIDTASLTGDFLLTPGQAAGLLGISAGTLAFWRDRGPAGPPHVQYCNGSILYRLGDLRRFAFDLQAVSAELGEAG